MNASFDFYTLGNEVNNHPQCLDPLLKLIKILEDLFFSMSVSEEIANKYNILKQSAFTELSTFLAVPYKHKSPILFDLITIQRYPNIRKVGEHQAKQVQYEVFNAMLRLSVELLHYQDYQSLRNQNLKNQSTNRNQQHNQIYLNNDVQMSDLMRMADNIEKLLDYLPCEEIDSLKIMQNYLSEYRQFIRDRDQALIKGSLNSREQVQINYLKEQIEALNDQLESVNKEKNSNYIQNLYILFIQGPS